MGRGGSDLEALLAPAEVVRVGPPPLAQRAMTELAQNPCALSLTRLLEWREQLSGSDLCEAIDEATQGAAAGAWQILAAKGVLSRWPQAPSIPHSQLTPEQMRELSRIKPDDQGGLFALVYEKCPSLRRAPLTDQASRLQLGLAAHELMIRTEGGLSPAARSVLAERGPQSTEIRAIREGWAGMQARAALEPIAAKLKAANEVFELPASDHAPTAQMRKSVCGHLVERLHVSWRDPIGVETSAKWARETARRFMYRQLIDHWKASAGYLRGGWITGERSGSDEDLVAQLRERLGIGDGELLVGSPQLREHLQRSDVSTRILGGLYERYEGDTAELKQAMSRDLLEPRSA